MVAVHYTRIQDLANFMSKKDSCNYCFAGF